MGYITRRQWLLSVVSLILLCFVTFLCHGCYTETGTDNYSSSTPPATANETLPWSEAYGRFYTTDLARAQEEIPFPIILPSYVPDKRKDAPPPGITGPLGEYQYNDEVQVDILYSVDLGDKVPGIIEISESNYPVLPPDPRLNPEFEAVEIYGKRMVKTEGDFGLGPGVAFFFSCDTIYFVVTLHNFPAEEAVKIVESIIQQME